MSFSPYLCIENIFKMTVTEVFNDIAGIIAHLNPAQIVGLKAPQQMSTRIEALVNMKKQGSITQEELLELERFLALDLFISLTKAQARVLLTK
jgi:hypothetical protein